MSANPKTEMPESESPASRARFFDPENFFAFKFPAVPRRQFLSERDQAFSPECPTGEILLDARDTLETNYAATTPLLLARYLRIKANDRFAVTRRASAEIFYVFQGTGKTTGYGECIEWNVGDVFCFPGGSEIVHEASTDTILFTVCNEPLLVFEDLQPSATGHARVKPLHWSREVMDQEFEAILNRPDSEETAGRALQLASDAMAPARHPIPSMNAAINTLEPGCDQRPHRHNGVAITLAIAGENIYSMIEDEKVQWSIGAAQVTPATELHSHHNRGTDRMVSLVIQDEGFHFYTRTPGFSWT